MKTVVPTVLLNQKVFPLVPKKSCTNENGASMVSGRIVPTGRRTNFMSTYKNLYQQTLLNHIW